MNTYQKPDGSMWAFEDDGSQDHLITTDMVLMTDVQITAAHAPTVVQLWAAYQAKAQAQLDDNDKVATRCIKANVAYPTEWFAFDEALRNIVRASTGDPSQPFPTKPAYPAGT